MWMEFGNWNGSYKFGVKKWIGIKWLGTWTNGCLFSIQIHIQTAKKTELLSAISATISSPRCWFRTKLWYHVSNAMSLIFSRLYPATHLEGESQNWTPKTMFCRHRKSGVLPICEDDRRQELVDHTHVMRMLGSKTRRLPLMLVILADIAHNWRKCTR